MANIPIETRRKMINTFMENYLEGKDMARMRLVSRMALSSVGSGQSIPYTTLTKVAGIIYDNLYSGVCLSYDYTASV